MTRRWAQALAIVGAYVVLTALGLAITQACEGLGIAWWAAGAAAQLAAAVMLFMLVSAIDSERDR